MVPVNPKADEVEGLQTYPDLSSIPGTIDGVSIITPPAVTERVVQEAIQKGIKTHLDATRCRERRGGESGRRSGANVIAGGPCILVSLRFRDE